MPRILILYGSVRQRSYSRFAAEEAGRLLSEMGAEVKIFNPSGLPLPDDALETHQKVRELQELVRWCDGMVWSSPERHGAMSSVRGPLGKRKTSYAKPVFCTGRCLLSVTNGISPVQA